MDKRLDNTVDKKFDKKLVKKSEARSLLSVLRDYVVSPYAGSTRRVACPTPWTQGHQLEQLDRSLAKLTIAQPCYTTNVPSEASIKAGTTVQTIGDTGNLIVYSEESSLWETVHHSSDSIDNDLGDLTHRSPRPVRHSPWATAGVIHEANSIEGFFSSCHYSCYLKNQSLELAFTQGANLEDKEMNRAIPSRFDFSTYTQQAGARAPFQDLGAGAWIADLDNMPCVPGQLEGILKEHASQPFSAAHFVTSLFNTARVLYVPKEYRAEHGNSRGIELHRLFSEPQQDGGDSQSLHVELLIIIVEEGAQIVLNDLCAPQGFQARAVIGYIGPRARVSSITDYRYGQSAYGLEHERWAIGADANLTRITGLTGGAQSWHMIDYTLADRANIEHINLSAHTGGEQSALTTIQRHAGAASKSSVLVKSVLQEESQSFYRGTISIAQEGKQSEAHQQQRALILGSRASTCAIPSLEVATHDVRCSHGSAAGRFNAAEMHYLLSRGFDRESAQRLLIQGFFHDEQLVSHAGHVERILKNLVIRCRKSSNVTETLSAQLAGLP